MLQDDGPKPSRRMTWVWMTVLPSEDAFDGLVRLVAKGHDNWVIILIGGELKRVSTVASLPGMR